MRRARVATASKSRSSSGRSIRFNFFSAVTTARSTSTEMAESQRTANSAGDAERSSRSDALSHVAPCDLGDANQCQQPAIERPANVVDHEPLKDCGWPNAQPLHHPDRAHRDHQQPDKAADDSHDDVESVPHLVLPGFKVINALTVDNGGSKSNVRREISRRPCTVAPSERGLRRGAS